VSFYRNTYASIDLDALSYNIRQLAQHHQKGLIAIIKANAYGHGDEMIAKYVLANGAVMLGVSSLDEAMSLRRKKVIGEILSLGYVSPTHLPIALKNQIILTASSLEWVKEIVKCDCTGLRIHIKVDTGMNRIGMQTLNEVLESLALLLKHNISVEGIYTHFSSSDDPSDTITKKQYEDFEKVLAQIDYDFKWVHASNSDAALHFDTPLCNAVRIGLAMYGYSTYPNQLKPVLTLYSALVHVKTIKANESVSYGATYTATQDEIIGTIPIGYADGWNRMHQGDVAYIGSTPCEYVGRICMDQCMIRLDKEYPVGTLVELLGSQAKLFDMAKRMHTISYEILTQISDRIPRVFVLNNKVIKVINTRFRYDE